MATATRTEEWGRWSGSIGDITDLASTVLPLVRERVPADAAHQELAGRCNIAVQLPGLDTEYGSPEELRTGIRDADLPRLERLRLSVGSLIGGGVLAVTVTFSQLGFKGATLVVEGNDRATVEGVAKVLTERLEERGARRHIDPFWVGLSAFLLMFLSLLPVVDAGDSSPNDDELTVAELLLALGFFAGLGACAFLIYKFAAWVSPQLEVVPVGERTRWRRVRARVWAAAGALVAALIGVVLDRLL